MYTGHVCGVLEALGRSVGHLGAVLDVSGGLVEPVWWHLKRSWSRLGRVLGAPGASWSDCGGIFSALGAVLDGFGELLRQYWRHVESSWGCFGRL